MKKMFLVIAVLCIIAGVGVTINKANKANDMADYWYQKYVAEKEDHANELKSIGTIIYDAMKNDMIDDHEFALWFEDYEYCTSQYCAVYVSPDTIRVIK